MRRKEAVYCATPSDPARSDLVMYQADKVNEDAFVAGNARYSRFLAGSFNIQWSLVMVK